MLRSTIKCVRVYIAGDSNGWRDIRICPRRICLSIRLLSFRACYYSLVILHVNRYHIGIGMSRERRRQKAGGFLVPIRDILTTFLISSE